MSYSCNKRLNLNSFDLIALDTSLEIAEIVVFLAGSGAETPTSLEAVIHSTLLHCLRDSNL